ncbi:MAG: histidinol-phosphatase [Treponema sp.]|nr:histidinol-phosphatase [Treponema sp.]
MNTLLTSLHTHTTFCDGKDDIETMCEAAYKKNLYAVGFSAHVPIEKQIGRKSDWNLKEENVNEYVNEVRNAKKRWFGKLNVYLGFEADYIKGLRSPLDNDITSLNPDYLIGSAHFVSPKNGAAPFTVDGPIEEFEKGLKEGYNGDAQALMNDYYDTQLEMIEAGGFDILGHADIIKKNCYGKNLWRQEDEINRQKEIAKAAAKTGIVIEVNTGAINQKRFNEVYPSLSFLKIIKEFDIPVIITADAHKAEDIDGNYEIALQTLNLAGFSEHIIINCRINEKIMWKKEKIIK